MTKSKTAQGKMGDHESEAKNESESPTGGDHESKPEKESEDHETESMDVDQDEVIAECNEESVSSCAKFTGDSKMCYYPTPISAPLLTEEILKYIQLVEEKFSNVDGIQQYTNNNWLEDLNIDQYMQLIQERSIENPKEYPSVYYFDCVFYKLLHTKNGKGMGYSTVKDTTVGENIFAYDIIFIPCYVNRHWLLVVVDVQGKHILLYDSLKSSEQDRCLKNITMYLKKEYERVVREAEEKADAHALAGTGNPENQPAIIGNSSNNFKIKRDLEKRIREKVTTYFDADLWTIKPVNQLDIPRQSNSSDCGVFLLQYAEYISRKMPFDFTQVHMPYFRKKMIYETANHKLMSKPNEND